MGIAKLLRLGLFFVATNVWAAELYWFGNDSQQGGGGTWSSSPSSWSITSPLKTPAAAVPSLADTANLGGTPGTIAITSNGPAANLLRIDSTDYVLQWGNNCNVSINSFGGAGLPYAAIEATGSRIAQFTVAAGAAADFTGTVRNGFGTLSIRKSGGGRLVFSGSTVTYGGTTLVEDGTLAVGDTTRIGSGLLTLSSSNAAQGVIELCGVLERTLGTGVGNIQLGSNNTHSGGFGAWGGDLELNLNGGSQLIWGTAGTFRLSTLVLGSPNSTGTVALFNPLRLDFPKTLHIGNGAAAFDAHLGGEITTSNSSALTKTGKGSVVIDNFQAANLLISEGAMFLSGTMGQISRTVEVASAALFGGDGTVTRNVVVHGALRSGGIDPQSATLRVDGNLTAAAGSQLIFGIGSGGSNDRLERLGGGWTFPSNQGIQLIDIGINQVGVYPLITGLAFNETYNVSGWQIVNSPGFEGTFSYADGTISVTLTAAPSLLPGDYGRLIIHPTAPSSVLTAAANDAVDFLYRMTGQTFTKATGNAASTGIVLARSSDPLVPAPLRDRLAGAGKEPYLLFSQDSATLLIIANDDLGLSHGLYDYLGRLGMRWYLPGENWTIIPQRSAIRLRIDEVVEADMRSRAFFGTGGFGIRTPLDNPTGNLTSLILETNWKRRNRWGAEVYVGGHSGEQFVTANETILAANPDYLAFYNGIRQPLYDANGKLRQAVKLDLSNSAVADLYANWVVGRLNALPNSNAFSIEPADGGGHCECPDCMAIGTGSVSDRVFSFANKVAQRVKTALPARDVLLTHYAYNEHADTPSFPLEPNLYVQVAAAAFQSTSYTPNELLLRWGEHLNGRNVGTYDYWILPDSNRDMPSFNYLDTPASKIRFWYAAGLDSYNIETTYGGAPMGLGLWLTSNLSWNVDFNEVSAAEEFYTLCFGGAKLPMKRLLERWARGYQALPQMLGSSFNDMQEALTLAATETPAVQARVREFANYLQFTRLYTEYRDLPVGDPVRSLLARDSIKLLWRMYNSMMIHSFRVQWMIRLKDEAAQPWILDFDMQTPSAPGWGEILAAGPISSSETAAWIASGVTDYGPDAWEIPVYSSNLVPLTPQLVPGPSVYLPTRAFSTYGYTRFFIDVPSGISEVRVRAKALFEPTPSKPPIRLQFADSEGSLFETTLTTTEEEIALPTHSPGTYELTTLSMSSSQFTISLPGHPTAITKFEPYQRGDYYFYVPEGLELVIFKITGSMAPSRMPVVKDGAGDTISYTSKILAGNNRFFCPNPNPGAAQIWKLEGLVANDLVQMISVPQSLAFTPETLMVPSELLPSSP